MNMTNLMLFMTNQKPEDWFAQFLKCWSELHKALFHLLSVEHHGTFQKNEEIKTLNSNFVCVEVCVNWSANQE